MCRPNPALAGPNEKVYAEVLDFILQFFLAQFIPNMISQFSSAHSIFLLLDLGQNLEVYVL